MTTHGAVTTSGATTTGIAPPRQSSVIGPGVTLPPGAMVVVVGEFDVFRARELAAEMATHVGFNRPAVYRLVTAVSELGNNLVDHTRTGGRVSLMPVSRDGVQGIEVVVEDDGPGICDTEMAMTDGFSSGHGLGSGLPGCRRLMDEFALESASGQGTRVTARLWLQSSTSASQSERWGAVPVVIGSPASGTGRPTPDEDPGPPPRMAHPQGYSLDKSNSDGVTPTSRAGFSGPPRCSSR